MALIELAGVEKTYTVRSRSRLLSRRTTVRAVNGISLQVERGEMVGYIGPNGAGKSTTIKMVTGILAPSGGRVRVAGLDPTRDRVTLARRMGVVFGQRSTLWWDLPVSDSFELLRHLYRVPTDTFQRNLERHVELLDMASFLATPVRQLSLGQRMRADIAAALLHDPEILLLDEPTIGLDVVSKSTVRGFLERLNAQHGTTVLLTTHDLGDIERLCKRIVVIDHGVIAFDGALTDLRQSMNAERTLVVDLPDAAPPLRVPGARVLRTEGPRQYLAFPAGDSAAALIQEVMTRTEVVDLSVREPDIADVVKQLYRGSTETKLR